MSIISAQALATSLSSSAPFVIEGVIVNNNSTNSQLIYGTITQQANTLALLLSASASMGTADWTIDTTQDQTFAVTAQFASASTAATLTCKHVSVELT